MAIGAVKSLGSLDPRQIYGISQEGQKAPSFVQQLQQAIQDVNQKQIDRDEAVQDMVAGRATEVHDVMIAARESQLAFDLLLEVRNKLLEAYQEIMRLQV